MTQTIRAIYENGILRPLSALRLNDQEMVEVLIRPLAAANGSAGLAGASDPLEGLRVATGIADLAERFDDYRFGRMSP